MASGSKKTKMYKGDDKVDEWLLNQVVKYVNHDELDSLARDLKVKESVYSNTSHDKVEKFKVRDLWVEESV